MAFLYSMYTYYNILHIQVIFSIKVIFKCWLCRRKIPTKSNQRTNFKKVHK